MSSVSNSTVVGNVQITIAKQQLEQAEQEGRNAIKLMKAAGAAPTETAAATPPPNQPDHVGATLNVAG